MTRRTHLHPHLSDTVLSERARHAPTLVEARRWQLLALIADGKTAKAAATLVGLQEDYAGRIVRRYNREGPASLRDRRLELVAPKRPALLTPEQVQELAAAVQGPAPGGSLWTGPLVAQWIAEKTGRAHVAPQRGHDYLKRLRMSPQVPRPRHHQIDPTAHAAFQESSQTG